ncbi:MAG TPA: 16S rRNA (uracil(1498)-N(3))-methyltransferase [Alphaproteobacteria bacterium]|nr:16S rRNA (uracil(1498)-N(3))-methyltransferase [Alphaproteobacteria bacterium]
MPPSREHIRIYIDAPLSPGAQIALSREQAHYLRNVMRRSAGGTIGLFNGRDGEWRASLTELGKQHALATLDEQIQAQRGTPDLWLICALIKRARLETIAEKAAELGVREIHPVITEYTHAPRMNTDRLAAITIEAAEQCGLVSIPKLCEPEKLHNMLDHWPSARRILFCDEAGAGSAALARLQAAATPQAPWAVLIGPEGGFSPAERDRLLAMPQTLAVSLGPRILRADTAAIAALGLWQSVCGDWDNAPVAIDRTAV